MLKSLLIVLTLGIIAHACTGCATKVADAVPQTTFSVFLGGHPATFSGPKDMAANSIVFSSNSNGVQLSIKGLKASTNPDSISAAAAGQVAIETAHGQNIIAALKEGANLSGTILGATGKAALKP